MRIIYYDSVNTNDAPCRHYLNLDRIDCFTFSELNGVTSLYAVMGDDVHKLDGEKKIDSTSAVMSYLMNLADRSRISVSEIIDQSNKNAKAVKQKR